ncbi:hypothetical protein [Aequorivita capsosiphonis]|uniref:hypothetical protein n=1 Tax=Aequorivita capsosiphonis TaxID=487317 RepID=UPI000418C2A4|nr:hypothetical protein [Aequorivita capsosiphonis]
MKNILLLFTIMVFIISPSSIAENKTFDAVMGKKKIELRTSEKDAEIFMNGRKIGTGTALIVVPKEDCVVVIIKKESFLTEKIEFCNKKEMEKLSKTHTVQMRPDESHEATVYAENLNRDIILKCENIDKDQAWKLINQILLTYVDVIEMADKETGYLRTGWNSQTYTQNTVRTRFIIKETSTEPLVFKLKLISQQSQQAQSNPHQDQLFKDWDRLLRKYTNAISEFQARIK